MFSVLYNLSARVHLDVYHNLFDLSITHISFTLQSEGMNNATGYDFISLKGLYFKLNELLHKTERMWTYTLFASLVLRADQD